MEIMGFFLSLSQRYWYYHKLRKCVYCLKLLTVQVSDVTQVCKSTPLPFPFLQYSPGILELRYQCKASLIYLYFHVKSMRIYQVIIFLYIPPMELRVLLFCLSTPSIRLDNTSIPFLFNSIHRI